MAAAMEQQSSDCYKYQWARYVAKSKLDIDFKNLSAKVNRPDDGTIPRVSPAHTISELARSTVVESRVDKIGLKPRTPGEFKVGIVGAGCAGLFTGLLLDWLQEGLQEEFPKLKISYDIIEAAGPDRLGGRLYTHKFTEKKHDYYDIGAMRFPDNNIMNRTFRLFEFLGLKKGEQLIPYYFEGNNCPNYYNDIQHIGSTKGIPDPYKINEGLSKEDQIPPELLLENPDDVIKRALKGFIDVVRSEFEKRSKDSLDQENGSRALWDLLMKADDMSVRQFLRSKTNTGFPDGPGYNFNTIEWLETFTLATGWYDQSLTETVIDILDFEHDAEAGAWCIDGGTQQVASLMAARLKKKPEFYKQVVAINAQNLTVQTKDEQADRPYELNPVNLTIQQKNDVTETREYFAVFNSTTLGALQRMDLKKAGLLYGTKQAIRSLGYGASCKVGMKFRTRWWTRLFGINKAGVGKTDLPLRVCVYPSYNIDDPEDESAVLLCSYTWAQDAQRIGTLITENSPEGETELKKVLFHNLALLHANEKHPYEEMMELLAKEYITHHAYDWYADNDMSGAFAYFGPSQFSKMWPEIYRPDAFGRLFFIGEAASAHHAWIVGALESSVRAVYQLFNLLHLGNPDYEPYVKAMEKLTKDEGILPFYGLPKEMPKRQLDTPDKDELVDELEEGKRLTYTAAHLVLGFLESLVEAVEAEKKA